MECLSPIKIVNPRKFFALDYNDTFVQFVRCGKCANCQETLQKEWYFRAFHEYKDCVSKNGYMLMECLTYSPKYVPRVARFIRNDNRGLTKRYPFPKKLDFMCFDYNDIRLFFVNLRIYLTRLGYNVSDTLRYFYSCEYGTREDRTHRPHVHILFYVTTPNLDNLTLSRAISHVWKLGRTDGLPYKSRNYVNDMTITGGVASAVRSCKYVSKYVMKSSYFQRVVDRRIGAIMNYLFLENGNFFTTEIDTYSFDLKRAEKLRQKFDNESFESWLKSETAKKYHRDLCRHLNQFHRQSLGFGASWLNDVDIDEIIDTNIISVPDGKTIVSRLGLPMYYRRKLFYEVQDIDGMKSWQPTSLGRRYLDKRKQDRKRQLIDEYNEAFRNYRVCVNAIELSDYVLNKRGRIIANNIPIDIDDILSSENLVFNYCTSSDKKMFSERFVSDKYLGYHDNYFCDITPANTISLNDFISEYVYFDKKYEDILQLLEKKKVKTNKSKQKLFDLKQRLNQVYKNLSV